MSSIPEDIYLEILLRVPAKSTFVCKCVCKTWLSLISDPSFLARHIDFTLCRNVTSNLMLCNSKMLSINIDSLKDKSTRDENEKFTEVHYPYESLGYTGKILGSCNGLVCLMLYPGDMYKREGEEDPFFCVWNPTTREYKKLNRLPDEIYYEEISMHTFGYDHKNHDYKLVIGVPGYDGFDTTLVYVHAIESGSWKSAITVPYHLLRYKMTGVLVNGYFHYLVSRGVDDFLIATLDITEESFKEIEVSPELKEDGRLLITEAVLEGCLGVVTIVRPGSVDDESYPGCVELWVMQDYGVKESWTRRYIIKQELIPRTVRVNPLSRLNLVSSSKNGEILLMMNGWLILYDPKDGNAIQRYMAGGSEVNYIESLVSVNSGTYVSELEH